MSIEIKKRPEKEMSSNEMSQKMNIKWSIFDFAKWKCQGNEMQNNNKKEKLNGPTGNVEKFYDKKKKIKNGPDWIPVQYIRQSRILVAALNAYVILPKCNNFPDVVMNL